MRRNILSFGDRSICGDYGKVKSAGDLHIMDSSIRKLSCAGDINILNSTIKKVNCAGALSLEKSRIEQLKMAGSLDIAGVCQGEIMAVMGKVTAEYLECKILKNGFKRKLVVKGIENGGSWSGSFKAITFENTSSIDMNFEYDFTNILNNSSLTSMQEIVCENFYNFGEVYAPLVNAENVFILNGNGIKIDQIVGTNVYCRNSFVPDQKWHALPKTISYKKKKGASKIIPIPVIEADFIHIEYTKANLVSGQDVIIGDLCIIERVEYRNSIKISEKSVVNEVVKL